MKRFLEVRQEEDDSWIEATLVFDFSDNGVDIDDSPNVFWKNRVVCCFAITKYCSKLCPLHNLINKAKIN